MQPAIPLFDEHGPWTLDSAQAGRPEISCAIHTIHHMQLSWCLRHHLFSVPFKKSWEVDFGWAAQEERAWVQFDEALDDLMASPDRRPPPGMPSYNLDSESSSWASDAQAVALSSARSRRFGPFWPLIPQMPRALFAATPSVVSWFDPRRAFTSAGSPGPEAGPDDQPEVISHIPVDQAVVHRLLLQQASGKREPMSKVPSACTRCQAAHVRALNASGGVSSPGRFVRGPTTPRRDCQVQHQTIRLLWPKDEPSHRRQMHHRRRHRRQSQSSCIVLYGLQSRAPRVQR